MSHTVAILCGGLGTRLRPLTDTLPKSLVTVAGIPFIDYQLQRLAEQGIERVVLCIGYCGEQIAEHVGSGQRFGLDVAYSSDGADQLGTAGALRKALPFLGIAFGVLYGDVYPLYDLHALEQSFILAQSRIMMAVRSPGRGNVTYEDGRVTAYGHGLSHGDAGFSVCGVNLLRGSDDSDLGHIFSRAARRGHLDGYEVIEPGYEVGSIEGLARFERYVLHARVPV